MKTLLIQGGAALKIYATPRYWYLDDVIVGRTFDVVSQYAAIHTDEKGVKSKTFINVQTMSGSQGSESPLREGPARIYDAVNGVFGDIIKDPSKDAELLSDFPDTAEIVDYALALALTEGE